MAGGGAAGAAMPVQFGQLSKAEMLAIVKEQVGQKMCKKKQYVTIYDSIE